ncbi:MAG: AI-2E family transporter [Alphaproteobacteria bacterium]|nr:AI-2E family transporter [Alphaproteobacteria bacterium]
MNKTLIWTLIIALFGWFVYISSDVLMPFITSLILAYFISPLADTIEERFNFNRGLISFFIVSIIGIIFLSIWVALIPVVYEQIASFIKYLPKHKEYFDKHILSKVVSYFDVSYQEKFNKIVSNIFSEVSKGMVSFVDAMWKSGLVFVNIVIMIVLVPLITFYFIRDWRVLSSTVDHLVPVDRKNSFHELARDINNTIAGFIRGQLNICLILAIYYGSALSLINLNFGVLIGITTGIISFVPFLGLLGGFVAATIVSLFQFQSWEGFLLVVGVFIIGNILESVMAPRLIGNRTGVSPIWIVFFVLLGGSLFGILGMFFAVPVGASIAVIIKFTVKKYYKSSLYKGNS